MCDNESIEDLLLQLNNSSYMVETACVQAENMLAIRDSINKYGITKQLTDLVGVEAIEIVKSIKSVVQWIVVKLKQFLRFIVKILARISADFVIGIRRLLHKDRPVQTKYKVESVLKKHDNSIGRFRNIGTINPITTSQERINDYVTSKIKDVTAEFKSDFSTVDQNNNIKEQVVKSSILEEYIKVCDRISMLCKRAVKLYKEIIEKLTNGLQHLGTNSDEDVELDKFVRDIPGLTSDTSSLFCNIEFEPINSSTTINSSDGIKYIKTVISVVNIIIPGIVHIHRYATTAEIGAIRECHNTQKLIHIVEPIPDKVVDELNDYYGGQGLKLRNVILSNSVGGLRSNGVGGILGGYSSATPHSKYGTLQDIWISADSVNSLFNRAILDGSLTKTDSFIQILVHECRHVYDGQHGDIGDIETDYDKYRASSHEVRARRASRKYQASSEMKNFVNKVIAKLSDAMRGRAEYIRENKDVDKELE